MSMPKKVGRWKHLAESVAKTYRSVLVAPSWLSSNRAWKIAPWVCDVHRRVRYMQTVPVFGSTFILAALVFGTFYLEKYFDDNAVV